MSNGKVDFHTTQTIVGNVVLVQSLCLERNEKETLSSSNRNGTDKIGKVDAVAVGNIPQIAFSSGNRSDSFVLNGTRSVEVVGKIDTALSDISNKSENSLVPKRKYENSCNLSRPKRKSDESSDYSVPMSKPKDWYSNFGGNRKFKDSCDHSRLKKTEDTGDFSLPMGKSCVLLFQDAQSRVEVENMKEMKKLIANAKPTFIPQIPESPKEELIKHLQSFSQTKQESPDL